MLKGDNQKMIESGVNLRPCVVDKKQKGYFHRWEEKVQPVAAAATIGGPPAGQLAYTLGIVELEDGTVIECFPYKIRFLDRQNSKPPQKKSSRKAKLPPRWAPESEIDEACTWVSQTTKPSMWPCGSDGEKACDTLCKQCWEKWKEDVNHESDEN
jgi:hypothetical protein